MNNSLRERRHEHVVRLDEEELPTAASIFMKVTIIEELRVFGVVAVAPLVEHADVWTLGPLPTKHTLVPIINGGVLQTHAAELPRGRACPVCSQLNRAGQRGGSGSSVPRPAVCVRASSHTSSNNGKKEVSTTTTQKAMRGPWTCGASKMGRNKRREGGGKNPGPSLIGEGHTQVEVEEDNDPLPPHSIANLGNQ